MQLAKRKHSKWIIIIITNERYVSFGNSHTRTHTQIHTIKHTNTHQKLLHLPTHTQTHIHAEFMLQIKANRHAYAPPLVFALQIHVQIRMVFLCIDTIPYHMFPSKLSVLHNTRAYTHTRNILPATKYAMEFDQVLLTSAKSIIFTDVLLLCWYICIWVCWVPCAPLIYSWIFV